MSDEERQRLFGHGLAVPNGSFRNVVLHPCRITSGIVRESQAPPPVGPKFALSAGIQSVSGTAKVTRKALAKGSVMLTLNAFGTLYQCGIITPIDVRYASNVQSGDVVLFEGSVIGATLSGTDAGYKGLLPCRLTAKPLQRQ